MKRIFLQNAALCALATLLAGTAADGQATTAAGRLEFVARVTPASGRTEPARGLTIYLLTRSFGDIERQALEQTPRPSLDAFVDRLSFSKQLKDWMKKHNSVTITGPDFRSHLSDDDLFAIPEFFDAYVNGNLSGLNQGFPALKYTAADRAQNTKKYEKYRKPYEEQLRKYLAAHPDSKEAMDTVLEQMDPSNAWGIEQFRWLERAHALALQIAQTDYLAAKTETNLEGRGAFQAAPGAYWLCTLGGEALGGEQHLRWNVAAEVRPGAVTHVELSNLNAEKKP